MTHGDKKKSPARDHPHTECDGQARCLQSLYKLYQMRDATLKKTIDFAMEEGIRVTESKIGYIALLNDDESVLTMYSWSKSAMAECQIPDRPLVFPVKDTGLWGEAVRQRKAIITNDYAAPCPYKKGYPDGHVAITRHMNVPIFCNNKIVLVAGVGNKDDEYNESDVEHLTLLMDSVWRFLERKHAQDAAIESERKFRAIFNHSFQFTGLLDINGNLIEANQPALDFIGADLSDLKGKPFWQCPWWTHDAELQKKMQQSIADAAKGNFSRYVTDNIDKNGNRRQLDFSIKPLRDESGKVVMLIPEGRDITDSKREEQVMQIRLDLVQFAASHTTNEILMKALDAAEELTDSCVGFYHFVHDDQKTLSLQAWSTRTLKQFCYAQGRGMHYNIDQAGIWVDCVRQRKPVIHNDYATAPGKKGLPPGHAALVRELVVPVMRNGKIAAIMGMGNKPDNYTEEDIKLASYIADIAWEISTRKLAEEQVKEDLLTSQRQLAILTNIAASKKLATGDIKELSIEITEKVARTCDAPRVGVWLRNDADKTIRCVDMYQLESDQHQSGMALDWDQYAATFDAMVENRYITVDNVMHDLRVAGHLETYIKPNNIASILDVGIRTSDKQLGMISIEHVDQPHQWNHTEITFACQIADQLAMAILNNERKKTMEQTIELERSLLQSQKLESLGVLAGGIAHDFNNILMTIMGNLEIAAMTMPADSAAMESIQEATEAAKNAADLTKQMLAYSGKGRFVIEEIDLNELVKDNNALVRAAIPRTVIINLELSDKPAVIRADRGQLQQVIMNLISNSWESFDDKGGTITITTGVKHCDQASLSSSRLEEKPPPGDFAFMEIADEGCGMDEQTMQKMFEPFFTTKFVGRGLGLSAVLGIVKGHNGAITVKSKPGKGTAIKILFPLCKKQAIQQSVNTGEGKTQPASGKKLLIIDDDESVGKICAIFAEQMGMNAVIAANGPDGIEMFKQHQAEIACVLTDLTMPIIDGVEVQRQIHACNPTIPIILTSGYTQADAAAQFSEQGFAGFIQKPYQLKDFSATIQSAINSK